MVRIAFTVIGAAVGFYFGGPTGALQGAGIGSAIGNLVDPVDLPGPADIQGPRLNDLRVSSSTYGRPIPIVYGTFRIGTNMIWSTDLIEHEVVTELGGGGDQPKGLKGGGGKKGGGPTAIQTTVFYTASFAVMICEGPAEVLKIWVGGEILFDATGDNTVNSDRQFLEESIALGGGLTVYSGSDTQSADPTIQADVGITNTPAYRGRCYIVFENFNLTKYNNRIPGVEVLVTTGTVEDAFPVTTVAGSTRSLLSRMRFSPDYRFLYYAAGGPGAEFMTIWDATAQEEILNVTPADLETFSSGTEPEIAVDALGFIYVVRGRKVGSSTQLRQNVYKYEPEGLSLVETSAVFGSGLSGDSLADMAIVGALSPLVPNYIVLGNSGENELRAFALNDLQTVIVFDMGDFPQFGSPVDNLTLGVGQRPMMTADREGRLWVLWEGSGGDAVLIEHSLPTLSPRVSFTIPGAADHNGMTYDIITNKIFIYDDGNEILYRFDIDGGAIDGQINNLDLAPADDNFTQFRTGPLLGSFWVHDSLDSMIELDLVNMTIIRTLDLNDWTTTEHIHPVYDPLNHAFVVQETTGSDLKWFFIDRKEGEANDTTLDVIVADLSDRVELASALYDVTALASDVVPGFAVTRRMPVRSALQAILPFYFADGDESDHVVKFVKRGAASIRSFTEDDLGATGGNVQVQRVVERRMQEVELPERVDFLYIDPALDYQTMNQHAKRIRESTDTVEWSSVEAPLVLTANAAKQIVEKALFLAWVEREIYRFQLTWQHIDLDPTDVITVTLDDGAVFPIYIQTIDIGADGVLKVEGTKDFSNVHLSSAGGAVADGVEKQTIKRRSFTTFFIMDTPLFQDADNGLLIYYAAGGGDDADDWPGSVITYALDGVNFTNGLASVVRSQEASHGVANGVLALPPRGPWTWDRTNTLSVRMKVGSLASVTEAAVLQGGETGNVALLGDEIIQFQNATLEADGTYTLDTLLRARRGTEFAMGGHAKGERFVVITRNTISRTFQALADIGVTRDYQATTLFTIRPSTRKSVTYTGASFKPYAPVHVTMANGGSPSDWIITWQWRSRINGDWLSFFDTINAEAIFEFEVDIVETAGSPTGEDNILRTIRLAASAGGSYVDVSDAEAVFAVYSEADQITDFGAPVASLLHARIYMMSELIGRGFAADEIL